MEQLLSVLARKQDEIIQVQKHIAVLEDWIRREEARDRAVADEASLAELARLAKRAERGAKGSSLLGVFLCGCCLAAMLLLGIWTHSAAQTDASPAAPGQEMVSVR